MMIIFGMVSVYVIMDYWVWPYSFFSVTLNVGTGGVEHLFAGISLEAIIITIGGILVLPEGSD